MEKVAADKTDRFKLKEMAQITGVSASTLYDYLRNGLLPPPVKISPTKSCFDESHIKRLEQIKTMRQNGKSIQNIRDYFSSDEFEDDSFPIGNDSVKIEIVDKALDLFSRYHYEKTKIVDITNALNIGSGTFYRYFNSKEELLLGCLERLPFVLVPEAAWLEVERETDFFLRLKKRGYAMLNAFPSYIGMLNYAKQALGCGDEILAKKAEECLKTLTTPLRKDLEKAVKQGEIRKNIDVDIYSHLLLGINETFGYLSLLDSDYSIEYGFGLIEDFLGHALAVKTKLPEYSCCLIDISDNHLELDSVCFNNNADLLSGKYLNGELQLSFSDIESINFIQERDSILAKATLCGTEIVNLELDKNDLFNGFAPFGSFSIKVTNIKLITFKT